MDANEIDLPQQLHFDKELLNAVLEDEVVKKRTTLIK